MKTLVTFFMCCVLWLNITAQVPPAFKYQAVARDLAGNVLANKPVSFRISILSGSATGTTVYTETHTGKTTNSFGLTDLEIGKGTPVTGTFPGISWGINNYFLKVEMDSNGGSSYQAMGVSQLLSVPYALYARDVESNADGDADATNELQKITISGTVLTLDKNGGSVTLPSGGTSGDNWGTQTVVTDATLAGNGTSATPLKIADNGITSAKIQDGAVITADMADQTVSTAKLGNLAVSADKIQNGAVITDKIANASVTGSKIAQASATNGQVLKWDGTTWKPAADETGSGGSNPTGPAGGDLTGIYPDPLIGTGKVTSVKILDGTITASDLADNAVTTLKIADGAIATADLANSTVTADKLAANAVTSVKIATGTVTGDKIAQSGAATGQTLKWSGTTWAPANDETGGGGLTLPFSGTVASGVPGFKITNSINHAIDGWYNGTADGVAIFGYASEPTTSETWGVGGISKSSSGKGVYGESPNIGVLGAGATGVYGVTSSTSGSGVKGVASSAIGETHGVFGESVSSMGSGVRGEGANGIWGVARSGYGVVGISKTENRAGVAGQFEDNTKSGSGVLGVLYSSTGSGVKGIAYSTTGTTYGIYGKSESSGGYGVYGESPSIGIYGKGRIGIYGDSNDESGAAVVGNQTNSSGYSGKFQGKFYVNGNVGIGALTPTYRLEVLAPGTTSTGIAGFYNSNGESKVMIRQNSNGSGGVNIYNTGGTGMISLVGEGNSYINGGDLGIGTTAPNYKLDVRGTIGNNTTLYHSDRRWKYDILPLKYGIQDLMKIHGVSYLWNVSDFPDMGFDRNVQFGFIAQEFEKVIPELVTTDKQGYKSIDYVKLTPVLVIAIQEQQKIIEGLKGENYRLKAENDEVVSRIERLEKLVGASAQNQE